MEALATTDRIHKEFLQAFEESETKLIQKIDDLKNSDRDISKLEKFNDLRNLGFTSSKTIQKAKNVSDQKYKLAADLRNLQDLQEQISKLRLMLPYKIISYGQIIAILEKYNLYIGRAENYIDIMPEENALHILNYSKNLKKNHSEYSNKNIAGQLKDTEPICAQEITAQRSSAVNEPKFNFYICAPHEMFKSAKDRFFAGREIFYNADLRVKFKYVPTTITMDPIVVHPLFIDNPIARELKLFHVTTAWGPEAKEPEIYDATLN